MEKDQINTIRHSFAHIMAAAVQKLWPDVKFGVGSVIEDGFYYDIDLGKTKISEDDFSKIENEMQKIISNGYSFEKSDISIEDAVNWAKDNNQPYKEELLSDLKKYGTTDISGFIDSKNSVLPDDKTKVETVSLYKIGEFTDLCRGPHISNTKDIGVFKIMKVAGAYWRGKETNFQMQRLYGVAFATQAELDEYLNRLEQAKLRDHRIIGKSQDFYHIDSEVGNGLVMWHPNGALLWYLIESYWYNQHLKGGYELVRSPHIGSRHLWEKSGHWGFYSNSMYPPLEAGQSLEDLNNEKSIEKSEQYLLKPMNCPFHIQIYKSNQHSYRELPIRWAEMGDVYRFEKTGELSGLTRVRGFTQDDAHIICRKSQVKEELKRVVDFILDIYKAFGFDQETVKVYLSLRDPKDKTKYAGDDDGWEFTQKILREVSNEKKLKYTEELGEAAFYGPKLDFKIKDVIGREWQCSTLQFDFNLPQRFDMTFANEESQSERPFLLHRALFGSMERFIGLLIEQYGGAFPVWLAPEQIRLITVNQTDEIVNYADKVAEKAKELNLRVKIDDSNESVGKKIFNAEEQKIPYVIVIGEKEVQSGSTTARIRGDLLVQSATPIKIDNLLGTIANEAKSHVTRSSV